MRLLCVSTCTLNQWSLDFDGNRDRIIQSIQVAKSKGARIRTGPELEISGYGCNDHFLEQDTLFHSWESLAHILESKVTDDIVCDIGMPVLFKSVLYNCRVICFNGRILLIRPKKWLAMDGNYREARWFTAWRDNKMYDFQLPACIEVISGQMLAPFGDAILQSKDNIQLAIELCEELFTPASPHIQYSLQGVHILLNGSASHHALRKLHTRIDLIQSASTKCGGVYLYANQQGCDGERLYYDGSALIACNGQFLAQSEQFTLKQVNVITAVVDVDAIETYRRAIQSRNEQAASVLSDSSQVLSFNAILCDEQWLQQGPSAPIKIHYHSAAEEISLGPAGWLWDYLRRSGASGYFLPLSGGIDSCATACIVASMCHQVANALEQGDEQVTADVKRLCGNIENIPNNAKDLANLLLHTAYLQTENSGPTTKERARQLTETLGCYHLNIDMQFMVTSTLHVFELVTGKMPKYKLNGGSPRENLALQNVQARLRMVLSYLLAQLLPWVRGNAGGLLVLGSANVDECLRGYFTKYDCSSADVNPIGGISKTDLRQFIAFMRDSYDWTILDSFLNATPTAELEPTSKDYVQKDEIDMGMTYEELSIYGKLRKIHHLGPFGMFQQLLSTWRTRFAPEQIAEKVKRFFVYHAMNRHKMTTLTPAYHAEAYSPDDHRFDLRPFLYNIQWNAQFRSIDQLLARFKA